MILAHTFLGKADFDIHVSEEEIFFLFCANQSRPVACGSFLLDNLGCTARSFEGIIHVGGTVTQIATALGLTSKLLHLTPYCGYTTLDIDFCLDRGLMRRAFFLDGQYKLLIDGEAIHFFTLPDPMMTSVHDKANWSYALEGFGETVDEPRTPPVPEYHPAPPSPRITVLSNNHSLQRPDVYTQLAELRVETARLRETVEDLTLQIQVSDLTHATEADCLYQEIADLRSELAAVRGSDHTEEPPAP